ncbi:MAG: hypothetical protein LBL00_04500 [Endomicrobium sp.]|jgi:hypothetical protein|nr:hypothetical protein [Endomicrobium sp.]
MKKIVFLFSLLIVSVFFWSACDKDDDDPYKFKGTVEIRQYPSGTTLSLAELAAEKYDSKIIFSADVKDLSANIVGNAAVSWGIKPAKLSGSIEQPYTDRMVLNVKTAYLLPNDVIEVQAGYGGVFSSIITITFTE